MTRENEGPDERHASYNKTMKRRNVEGEKKRRMMRKVEAARREKKEKKRGGRTAEESVRAQLYGNESHCVPRLLRLKFSLFLTSSFYLPSWIYRPFTQRVNSLLFPFFLSYFERCPPTNTYFSALHPDGFWLTHKSTRRFTFGFLAFPWRSGVRKIPSLSCELLYNICFLQWFLHVIKLLNIFLSIIFVRNKAKKIKRGIKIRDTCRK